MRRVKAVRTTESPGRSDRSDPKGAERRMRPCPRGLEDTCPIPRELCIEAYQRVGRWDCGELLDAFEWFVFEDEAVYENRSEGPGRNEADKGNCPEEG